MRARTVRLARRPGAITVRPSPIPARTCVDSPGTSTPLPSGSEVVTPCAVRTWLSVYQAFDASGRFSGGSSRGVGGTTAASDPGGFADFRWVSGSDSSGPSAVCGRSEALDKPSARARPPSATTPLQVAASPRTRHAPKCNHFLNDRGARETATSPNMHPNGPRGSRSLHESPTACPIHQDDAAALGTYSWASPLLYEM